MQQLRDEEDIGIRLPHQTFLRTTSLLVVSYKMAAASINGAAADGGQSIEELASLLIEDDEFLDLLRLRRQNTAITAVIFILRCKLSMMREGVGCFELLWRTVDVVTVCCLSIFCGCCYQRTS